MTGDQSETRWLAMERLATTGVAEQDYEMEEPHRYEHRYKHGHRHRLRHKLHETAETTEAGRN